MLINFDTLGYESSLFAQNMGSLILIPVIFPFFILGLVIVQKVPLSCPRIKKKAKEAHDRTFFNSILRFVEETYLIITLCSFINIRTVYTASIVVDFNYILSLASLCIVVGYPIAITKLYFSEVD